MPQEQITIQALREKFSQSQGKKWSMQMIAYGRLSHHPDLAWLDLLDALDRPDAISDSPTLDLHLLLAVKFEGVVLERRRAFWEAKIKEAGLDATGRISDWVSRSKELSADWKRSRDAIQIIDSSYDGSD